MYKGSFSVRWQGLSIVGTTTFYAISSSGVQSPDDSAGWTPYIQSATKDKPYLWTKVVTTYNDGSTSSSYSVSRQGTDGTNGTSFTPKGTALGHYETFSEFYTAFEGGSLNAGLYLCDQDSEEKANPIVLRVINAFRLHISDVGDAYNIDGRLWVSNGSKWVDFGDIKGADGKDGQNLTLLVSPSKFTFATDDNGQIIIDKHVHFYYYGMFGDEAIVDNTEGAEFSLSFPEGCNFEQGSSASPNVGLKEGGESIAQGFFNTRGIKRTNYKIDDDETLQLVATSSYFLITLTYNGFTASERVDIDVDISYLSGDAVATKKEWSAKYSSLESKVTEQRTLIEENQSQLTVQAGKIESKVAQTTYDANNKVIGEKISQIEQDASDINLRVKAVEGDYVKSAQIELMVTKDENGVIESDVTIDADKINLSASKKLKLSTNVFEITSTYFSVDGDGTMSCTKGYIGGFRINENFIGDQDGYNMYLTNSAISFGSMKELSNNDGCLMSLGEKSNSTVSQRALEIMSVTGINHNVGVGGFISVIANSDVGKYCTALELQSGWGSEAGNIDVTDPLSGNHAILIHSGDVVGFRPSFVRINKSKTLTDYEHTIDCYNTSAITLTLPYSPKIGQEYVVLQEGAKISFNGNGIVIKDRNGSNSTSWNSDTYYQESHLFYNGKFWIATYFTR